MEESLEQELILASWPRRAGAMLADGLLVAIVVVPVTAGLIAATGNPILHSGLGPAAARIGALLTLWSLTYGAYATVLMARSDGQTLGKRWAAIRVVRRDGERMTLGVGAFREVIVRGLLINLVGSFFAASVVIDVVLPLFDRERRALHDVLAETWVVEA